MQRELSHTVIGPLGLRTLLNRLHRLGQLPPESADLSSPPVVQVDAIWVTQLRPNGQVRKDVKGRLRPVKGRFKRPLLLALGLWPESQRVELLAWQLGKDEGLESWSAFLTQLEERGIRGQQGLALIIHDGGSGLCAALQEVHFDAAQQRCLFHKLRNIADALQLPDSLTPLQRRRQRRTILKEFRAIWQAERYATTLRRYRHVVQKYRLSQPKAVATLRKDFGLTLTYFRIEQAHPTWSRRFLRTTSRLERFNETLREHFDVARAYHSDSGILSVVCQEAARLKAKPNRE
jgi:transposase-like protein